MFTHGAESPPRKSPPPCRCKVSLITDWDASEEDLAGFDEQGIELVIVENPNEEREE